MQQKNKSQIFKVIIAVMAQLLVLLFSSIQVYADNKQELEDAKNNVAGDSDSDNGTQGNNNTNADYRSWGWHSEDMGYIMYFEDKDGSICQQVIQITWGDYRSQLAQQEVEASLGYRIPRESYTYKEVAEYLPGLEGPYYGGNPWGGQLDSWFENCDGRVSSKMEGATQHIPDILAIFQLAGQDNVNTLAAKYDKDDIRLVVEAVYWYKPIDAKGQYIFGGGYYQKQAAAESAGTLMGTVKTIARFNEGNSLGNSFGGFYYGTITNHSWPMQMYTAYKDEYCGVGAPATVENFATDTGSYSNNTIMNMNYGFGMHIIRVDNAMEQWYTYKTPSGLSGGSPGPAPEMPNPLGLTDEARPITIIKYYEYRTIEDGKPSYKRAADPKIRKQVCRIISVQDIFRHFSCNSFSTS